ncbi:MAG TPA: VOC family protein [Dehalococcoidales bacterium]|nr:VOC family protein [Dehalococcoidales bacterium]
MIQGIHHVGIAVQSIDTVAAFLKEMFGAEFVGERGLETPEFLSRMVKIGGSLFELLEPRGQGGLIERYISSRGEGIHHYSLQVDDPEEVFKLCDEKGMKVLARRFIHPKSAHGMLIEIIGTNERF